MPEFIASEVRGMHGSSSSERTSLLVGCDGDRDELGEAIENIGGDVQDQVGRTTLLVSIPRSDVDQLCGLDSVISVEQDKTDIETHSSGNFTHQTDSMM